MGPFFRNVNLKVKEQIKSICNSAFIEHKENEMSHAPENAELYHPIQNGHPSSTDNEASESPEDLKSCNHAKPCLTAKKSSDYPTNEITTYVSRTGAIGNPSELGDAKLLTRARRFKITPGSCFSFSSDGKFSQFSSHSLDWKVKREEISKSYFSAGCEFKKPSEKREFDASRRRTYTCQSDSSVNKKIIKPKVTQKGNKYERTSNSDVLQMVSVSKYKPNLSRRTAHLNDERMNADRSTQKNMRIIKMPRGLDYYQSRHPVSQIGCPNCCLKRDSTKYWCSKSFSSDNSASFGKGRNAVNNQRGSLKFRNDLQYHGHMPCRNERWKDSVHQPIRCLPNKAKKKVLMSRTPSKIPNCDHAPKKFSDPASYENSSPAVSEKTHCSTSKSVRKRSFQRSSKERINSSTAKTLCPRGIHKISPSDKDCTCIQIEKMILLQADTVIYEWHTVEKEVLNGKIIKELGSMPSLADFKSVNPAKFSTGGQGTVAWVRLPRSPMQYALKFKSRGNRSDKNWLIERREAKILQKLKHTFIVDTYHIYETDSALFMVFEYLTGGCLWNHIARIGTLPECYAIYYAACILTALGYLHERGIVYRDMKAENVVLDNLNRPKLIDFGMAKYFPSVRKQMQQDGSGENSQAVEFPKGKEFIHKPQSSWASPDLDSEIETDDPPTRYYYAAYLAPEIYEEPEDSNHFIDSWGLGYIMLEMILGYGIFLPIPWTNIRGQHLSQDWQLQLPSDMVGKLTPDCRNLIYKMLLRQPRHRLGLREVMRHTLFSRVPWIHLPSLRGPNLSKFRNPEEFHQQSFDTDSIYAIFNKKLKFCASKKPYFQGPNKYGKQSGNEYDDFQPRKKKTRRPVKPTDSYEKSTMVNNHGNRVVGGPQDTKIRLRRNNNNGPRPINISKNQ